MKKITTVLCALLLSAGIAATSVSVLAQDEKRPAEGKKGGHRMHLKEKDGKHAEMRAKMEKLTEAQKKELADMRRSHHEARLGKLVQFGALTKAEADEIRTKSAQRMEEMKKNRGEKPPKGPDGKPPRKLGPGKDGKDFPRPDMSKLTEAQKKELADMGKSHHEAHLNKLVQFGVLTRAEADEIKAKKPEPGKKGEGRKGPRSGKSKPEAK